MGIKFLCPNGHRLHVKSFLGGKKAICPQCGARVVVPLEGTPSEVPQGGPTQASTLAGDPESAEPLEAALVDGALAAMDSGPAALGLEEKPSPPEQAHTATLDAIAEAPAAVWYVRPAGGGQYGPASGQIMRSWLEQGRVGANSLVWRDGWNEWRSAAEVFPELGARLTAPGAAGGPPSVPANGMPAMQAAALPLGHVVEGVPALPPNVNPPPTMPPLAQAVRKRRRGNDRRLIFSAILAVLSLILIIVLVLVFQWQDAPSETPGPKAPSQEPPADDEGSMI